MKVWQWLTEYLLFNMATWLSGIKITFLASLAPRCGHLSALASEMEMWATPRMPLKKSKGCAASSFWPFCWLECWCKFLLWIMGWLVRILFTSGLYVKREWAILLKPLWVLTYSRLDTQGIRSFLSLIYLLLDKMPIWEVILDENLENNMTCLNTKSYINHNLKIINHIILKYFFFHFS